jgi:hypothetical protein
MQDFTEFFIEMIDAMAKAGFGKFGIAYIAICAWFLVSILVLRTPATRALLVSEKTKPILMKFFETNAILIGGSMVFWLGSLLTLMIVETSKNYVLIPTGQTQEKIGNLLLMVFAANILLSPIVTWLDLKAEKPSEKTKPETESQS